MTLAQAAATPAQEESPPAGPERLFAEDLRLGHYRAYWWFWGAAGALGVLGELLQGASATPILVRAAMFAFWSAVAMGLSFLPVQHTIVRRARLRFQGPGRLHVVSSSEILGASETHGRWWATRASVRVDLREGGLLVIPSRAAGALLTAIGGMGKVPR